MGCFSIGTAPDRANVHAAQNGTERAKTGRSAWAGLKASRRIENGQNRRGTDGKKGIKKDRSI